MAYTSALFWRWRLALRIFSAMWRRRANGRLKSSLHTVRQAYPSVQAVSRDGWILLRTPRFGQEAVLIPQAKGKNIRWAAHYNDTDKVINGKALCF